MPYDIRGTTVVELTTSVESAIERGTLPPGHRLPTVRELATRLGVNRNTVGAAYRRLAAAGLVVTDGRRGTRVVPRPPSALTMARGIDPGHRHLEIGGPDLALLPRLERALAGLPPTAQTYGDPVVDAGLAETGLAWFDRDGLSGGAVTVVNGALDGIGRLLRARLAPGDRVALEDPGPLAAVAIVRSLGLEPVPVPVDERGASPEGIAAALEHHAAAVLLTPRAHNPTGAVMDAERADAIRARLAAHPEVLVIEDDHCAALVDAPPVSAAVGHTGPWAVVRSVAKALGPDLRVALVLGDRSTVGRLEGQLAVGMRWVSHILQRLVAHLLEDEATWTQLAEATQAYDTRRQAFLDALADEGIAATGQAGLNVWVPVSRESAVVRALYESGWVVAPGEDFRLRSGPGIRVTTSTLLPEESPRLARAVRHAVERTGAGAFA